VQPSHGLIARIRRRWRRERIQRSFATYKNQRPSGLEPFSDDRTPIATEVVDQCPDAHILNLHWIANFVDLGTFFDRVDVPVVWTLHDMNAFTGGCHYNVGCDRYKSHCGACPQLGSDDDRDLSRAIWQRKSDAYPSAIDAGQLHIVAPSRWLAEEARQSTLFSEIPITVIPNGIDTTVFAPCDDTGLRQALGMAPDDLALLFVADSTTNQRKGFGLLLEALSGLDLGAHVHLMSVGAHEPEIASSVTHHHLGRITNDCLLAAIYSAADVFVIPSLQDNLPNTVLESMACGTPVVGFDVGGIPDMVRPEETGWLAETGDVPSLRRTIRQALGDDEARRCRAKRCREVAEAEYQLHHQADAYRQLYREVLASASSASGTASSRRAR
jgi:glycosyltransferase involved in cell wall biosynthesis